MSENKIIIGSARIGENGKITGGAVGDQRQTTSSDKEGVGEVSMQDFYVHRKGWYILRAKDDEIGHRLAYAIRKACKNKNIGYNQSDRYGVVREGIETKKKVNSDCSSLVRACIKWASGIDVGDFNTLTEATVLERSGLFYNRIKYIPNETPLYNGDILVTLTKGHTVVVAEGGRARKKKEVK